MEQSRLVFEILLGVCVKVFSTIFGVRLFVLRRNLSTLLHGIPYSSQNSATGTTSPAIIFLTDGGKDVDRPVSSIRRRTPRVLRRSGKHGVDEVLHPPTHADPHLFPVVQPTGRFNSKR